MPGASFSRYARDEAETFVLSFRAEILYLTIISDMHYHHAASFPRLDHFNLLSETETDQLMSL